MGKSINFKSFIDDDGDAVRFSSSNFRNCMSGYISAKRKETGQKYTQDMFREDVAKELHYSPEAIKKWHSGDNGPRDFSAIKSLAEFMGIDYHDLLEDESKIPITAVDKEKFKLTSVDEKDFIMQIYKLFVDYIYWFTGSYTKAYKLLENPREEHREYILNLYYLLDVSALSISKDIYYNLRRFISELEMLEHPKHYTVGIPKEWTDINPFLLSEDFEYLLEPNKDADIFDLAEKCGDDVMHMLFEDMPELHDVAKNWREFFTLMEDSSEQNNELSETGYRKERILRYEGYSDLYVLTNESNLDWWYDINSLVCREFANTLIKLMKKRFPQYFGNL